MKNRCKLQFHLVKQLQMLILLFSIVLGVTASAAGNSPYPQISVNVKKYDPTSGISRREFIEQTFGVKFGEELKNYIELKPSENNYITRNMTKPICGMEVVEFIDGGKNKLEEIRMRPPCETSRAGGWWFPFETYKLADLDVAKEKAKEECAKLCKLVEEWLMLEHLEVNGYEFLENRLIEENKTAKYAS